jgi:hypothetical protein
LAIIGNVFICSLAFPSQSCINDRNQKTGYAHQLTGENKTNLIITNCPVPAGTKLVCGGFPATYNRIMADRGWPSEECYEDNSKSKQQLQVTSGINSI